MASNSARPQPLYGVIIRESLASNDVEKMKATAEQVRQTLNDQGDLKAALSQLEAAIAKASGGR